MIRIAESKDAAILAALAIQMWGHHELSELQEEFDEILQDKEAACFIKYMDEKPIAFAHCQLRHDYVEGTESSPVGYLEGIFVEEAYRRKGFAADLLAECERWAREKGCSEFASDCELDNEESLKFCLAFTVEDVEKEYEKVLALGARIIEPPAKRPWGAVNMSFYDPDNNIVFLRQFVQTDNAAEIKS